MSNTVWGDFRVVRCIMLVKMCGPGPNQAPSPREGVWGEGNVGRRSPFAQAREKPALVEEAGCIRVRAKGLEPIRREAPDVLWLYASEPYRMPGYRCFCR